MTSSDPATGWMALTLGQMDFWEEYLAHPGQPVSTVAHLTDIRGPLDEDALIRALDALAAETDVLSLRFEGGPPPRQRIDPASRPVPRCLDLRGAPDAEGRARALMQTDLARPLDLCTGGLSALWLIRVGADRWMWYCRGHHIFLDGYGMAMIERRLAALYAQFAAGAPPGRPFGRLADVVREEADRRAGPAHDADRAFWRSRLSSGAPPPVVDKGAEDYPATPRAADIDLGELAAPLRACAARHGVGWPDLMTALIGLWLGHRGTGRENGGEPLLWLPLMNRFGSVSAHVPAMVLNIVPWHLDPPAATLGAGVAGHAATLRTLRRHGRHRVEEMGADHGLRPDQRFFFSPLVNVMPFDPPVLAGCAARREVLAAGPGDGFNVTVTATARAEGMRLILEADPHLTPAARFADHTAGLPRFLRCALIAADDAPLDGLLAVASGG